MKSEWHEIVEQVKAGTYDLERAKINRTRYSQGQTPDQRDAQDGERDALRVLAGLEPLWDLNRDVTAAYKRGWDGVLDANALNVV